MTVGQTDGAITTTTQPDDNDWKADLRNLEGATIVEDGSVATGDASGTSDSAERTARPAAAAASDGTRDEGTQSTTSQQQTEGTTTTGADSATGDALNPNAQTATDPLQGAEPLAYQVNGQSVTFEGAHVIPGEGAIITAEALPRLTERLSRADYLEGANRELYQATRQFERLAEYTPRGSETPVSGREGLETLRVEHARTSAALNVLASAFRDPDRLADMLAVVPQPDGSQRIQLNTAAVRSLLLEADNAEMRAEAHTRQTLAQLLQHASADPNQPSPEDVQTKETFERALTGFQQAFPQLTADDVQAARQQFGPFLSALTRPCTPDEARQLGIRPGAKVLDPSKMEPWVRDRVAIRQQQSRTVSQVTDAARSNAPLMTSQKRQAGGTPANRPAATDRQKDPENWTDARRDLRRAFRDAFASNG